MTPETELAIALCRTPLRHSDLERARRVINSNIDWNAFFAYASRAQVEPVALTNLQQLDSRLPHDVLRTAHTRARDARAIALSKTLLMNELLAVFEARRIPTIVIKGAATGISAYGDPSLRTFGDIDLLVRHQDILRARVVLMENGYDPTYRPASESRLLALGHALEFSNGIAKVELHARLLSRYLRLSFDTERVWTTSRRVQCIGRETRILAKEVEFVFLCAHGAKHEWMQLRWLADVAQLAERLTDDDTRKLVALASNTFAVKLTRTAVQLIDMVFGTSPENGIRGALPEGKMSQYVLGSVSQSLELERENRGRRLPLALRLHPASSSLRFWLGTRERMRDRIGTLWDILMGAGQTDGPEKSRWLPRPFWILVRAARRAATTT